MLLGGARRSGDPERIERRARRRARAAHDRDRRSALADHRPAAGGARRARHRAGAGDRWRARQSELDVIDLRGASWPRARGRDRVDRLPARPGGADQRHQARRRRRVAGHASSDARGRRRRSSCATTAGLRPAPPLGRLRPARDARAPRARARDARRSRPRRAAARPCAPRSRLRRGRRAGVKRGARVPRATTITGQCAIRKSRPLTPPTSTARSGPYPREPASIRSSCSVRAASSVAASPHGMTVVTRTSSGTSPAAASRSSSIAASISSRGTSTPTPPRIAGPAYQSGATTPMISSSASKACASSIAVASGRLASSQPS